MKKLSKILVLSVLAVFMVAGSAQALPWEVSPYSPAGGTVAFGETIMVGLIPPHPEGGSQAEGIYGAGFTTNVNTIIFDTDIYTWDSYSAAGSNQSVDGGFNGWWDVFVVNINQQGYYWDLVQGGSGAISSIGDPIVNAAYQGGSPTFDNSVLPGATWAFGGEDYGNSTLESDSSAPSSYYTLSMLGGDPTLSYYVSVILDTATTPDADTNYASWGSFHVEPIPEPATMLLLGTGLIGIAGLSRKRFKK